jgi:glycosyltransferase involved in cell wall biosynthesis
MLNPEHITIAYDAKRAFLNQRGLGNYSRTLLAQLKRYYGHNRYILCTPEDRHLYPWLSEAPFEKITPQGLWQIAPSVWRRYGITPALKHQHIDLYHGLSQELPKGIERLGCKTIVTMHDAIFMRYPELYSATYRASFIRRNQSACERADCIIAISEQTKRDFISFFGVPENRIRVVYQGCNDIYWQDLAPQQLSAVSARYQLPGSYVLSVGALEERKNHVRLIQAIAAAHIDLPVVIVGRGNERQAQLLRETAKRYGVSLQLIENARTEDLPAIYRRASVFVYPSLFEGFGIPILEAARCQTPIVTSAGTCFEEIAGEGALYVSPTDEQAIGQAIRDVLEHSEETSQRVLTALNNTEKFRAENITHNLMQTYYETIHGHLS